MNNKTQQYLEDIIMAHRYLYYVKNTPVISDYEYDKLEKEALENADKNSPIHLVGSESECGYSTEIKNLAKKLYAMYN